MSSLVWLNNHDSIHTWGIECLSTDKYTIENLVYNQVVNLCKKFNCHYFIQGLKLSDHGVSWAFIEFFGEGNQDKILSVIEEFNRLYISGYGQEEILLTEPSREVIKSLGLM